MTLYSVARANNISVSELAAANGIQPPYSVRTGQTLRIPAGGGTRTAAAPTESFAEPESTPIVEPKPGTPAAIQQEPFKRGPSVGDDGAGATHTVASGETLFSLGRKYGVSPFAIADANGLPNNAQLATGQKVRIPAGGSASAAKAAAPKLETAESPAETDPETAAQTDDKTAKALPAPPLPDESAAGSGGQQVAEQAPIAGAPGLRWPVRGKIISGFGPKANGLKNEGINIAVPEGTSIRAADSGVVAYAGNELKGYGNLVLIRHENGYVTAYAHAKELFVKRGDTVKRGDVIAKAGQTGSVSSPQLHFEVRKGATALDPMKFLSSSTASN
jgi:murein DD-endopeptidase MepM/ murein hydrolase activator NlpD